MLALLFLPYLAALFSIGVLVVLYIRVGVGGLRKAGKGLFLGLASVAMLVWAMASAPGSTRDRPDLVLGGMVLLAILLAVASAYHVIKALSGGRPGKSAGRVSAAVPEAPGATEGRGLRVVAALPVVAGLMYVAVVGLPVYAPVIVYGGMLLGQRITPYRCGVGLVHSYITGDIVHCQRPRRSPINAGTANEPIGVAPTCPLLVAVQYGNLSAFHELLNAGADPARCADYPNSFYESIQSRNCYHAPRETKAFLDLFEARGAKHHNPQQLLVSQVKIFCIPGIRMAVQRGADVNAPGQDGLLPLHHASVQATEASIGATALLVSLGADANRPARSGRSAYLMAEQALGGAEGWPRLKDALLGRVVVPAELPTDNTSALRPGVPDVRPIMLEKPRAIGAPRKDW